MDLILYSFSVLILKFSQYCQSWWIKWKLSTRLVIYQPHYVILQLKIFHQFNIVINFSPYFFVVECNYTFPFELSFNMSILKKIKSHLLAFFLWVDRKEIVYFTFNSWLNFIQFFFISDCFLSYLLATFQS